MTTTCKTCHRERHIKAAGMCRTCREKHLDKQMRAIGDAKARIIELIDHYGNAGTTARKIGISRNTVARIRTADPTARIQAACYAAIMTHTPDRDFTYTPEPEQPTTWADAAAYARTPEGLAFIQRCKQPAAYRTRKAA